MEQNQTDQQNPIETEVALALNRARERRSNVSDEPTIEGCRVIGQSHLEKLTERGFPARHLSRLKDGLHGPGLAKAEQLLPRVLSGDCLLFLVGDRGPGKTQIATWWALERLKAGKLAGWYRKTADLISEIKRTWSDGGKSVGTEDDILKKYRKTEYLVLDEFHERGSSDWEARTLINILDHRYDNMLATILIANMSEKQVRAEINPSIVSRAEETGGLVLCDWPSYRIQ